MRAKLRIAVRKATSKDAAGIVDVLKRTKLQNENWMQKEKWVKEVLRKFLKTQNYTILVAKAGGKTVGFISCVVFPSLWECSSQGMINDFFVREELMDKGVGTKLLEAIVEWADGEEISELHVSTDWENEPARRLYGKFGFTEERLLLERP